MIIVIMTTVTTISTTYTVITTTITTIITTPTNPATAAAVSTVVDMIARDEHKLLYLIFHRRISLAQTEGVEVGLIQHVSSLVDFVHTPEGEERGIRRKRRKKRRKKEKK